MASKLDPFKPMIDQWLAKDAGRMSPRALTDLERLKLPALRQAGARFPAAGPQIALFSKSGFKDSLVDLAAGRDDVRLVSLDEVAAGLEEG